MHAYDFILILFSFVYAAAVTHLLSTGGEIIIASKRLRLSWLNAGWMLAALLFTCAWWIGLWDLHVANTWGVGSIALYFCIAAGIYLQARLVSPRIPERGEFDLQAFHSEEGRKYLIAYALLSWVTVTVNAVIGQVQRSLAMVSTEYGYRSHGSGDKRGRDLHQANLDPVRGARSSNRRVDLVLHLFAVGVVRIALG